MKIYMYIAHLGAGGSERVCINLANEFVNLGHEVHIVTLNLERDEYLSHIDARCILHPLGVSRIRYSLLPLYRFFRKEKPISILVFSLELVVMVQHLKRLHFIDTSIILRNQNNLELPYEEETKTSPIVQKYLKTSRRIIKDMDMVIAQCKGMEQMLIDTLHLEDKKVLTIYNPVNPKLKDIVVLRKKQVHENKRIVLIGRMEPQKNTQHMLQAFAAIAKVRKDVSLHLVGDGYLRKELLQKAEEYGILEHTFFEGIRRDIENVYAEADVVVLSSSYEGMPNTLIEAISVGIPVVSYECPIGPSEIIENDVNGYLAKYMDVEDLSEKILRCLNKKWDREKIINSAKKFEVTKIADTYVKLLESIEEQT